MPTYQYQCDACGHGFEVLQSMTDVKLKECPECHKPELYRLIGTGGGIIFKGSGFYETDYKRTQKPDKADQPAEKPQKTEPAESKSHSCGSSQSCGCSAPNS